jgi:hypothetical protein
MDTVTVGGVSVLNHAFGVANESSFLDEQNNAGILGMAFTQGRNIHPTAQPSYMENIKNLLDAPLFTADFKKTST